MPEVEGRVVASTLRPECIFLKVSVSESEKQVVTEAEADLTHCVTCGVLINATETQCLACEQGDVIEKLLIENGALRDILADEGYDDEELASALERKIRLGKGRWK